MSIFVTGDIHGIHDIAKLSPYNFSDNDLTKNDYVIICGDCGILWGTENNPVEIYLKDFFHHKNYTLLYIDGNHENFDRLNNLKIEEWHDGKVHFISDNIIHLMRGQIFTIDGKSIFTMGGATSTDRDFRIKGETWWEEELPNKNEKEEAISNLKKYNYKVDYILTHTGPSSILKKLGLNYRIDEYTNWLEKINTTTKYKKWIFGHFHKDVEYKKHQIVFNDILMLI